MKRAYFLWIGSPLPWIAKLCINTAADQGFDIILFTDNLNTKIDCPITLCDYREILSFDDCTIRKAGLNIHSYTRFSDMFRYKLLSLHDGWWFDCDMIIMRSADSFSKLLEEKTIVLGYESNEILNGAVIGSRCRRVFEGILDRCLTRNIAHSTAWGSMGPLLLTKYFQHQKFQALLLQPESFYPFHHSIYSHCYLSSQINKLDLMSKQSYAVSLHYSLLKKSGLIHILPQADSFLGRYVSSYTPDLSEDTASLISYLEHSLDNAFILSSKKRLISRLYELMRMS